jgi:hypothetical protein
VKSRGKLKYNHDLDWKQYYHSLQDVLSGHVYTHPMTKMIRPWIARRPWIGEILAHPVHLEMLFSDRDMFLSNFWLCKQTTSDCSIKNMQHSRQISWSMFPAPRFSPT